MSLSLGSTGLMMTSLTEQAPARRLGLGGQVKPRRHDNGPAGDQDVWHYHLHVIPRSAGDQLHGGAKALYSQRERMDLAAKLRAGLL